jgi:long-chain acyl-CoA synthetase
VRVNERPDTIVSRFLDRAARFPERRAYTLYPTGALKALDAITWGDWVAGARSVAGALLAHRTKSADRVAIFAENRALWPVTHIGAAMVGAITVGIAPDADFDMLCAVLTDCSPAVVVVDTLARLKLVRAVQGQTAQLFTVVCDDLDPLRSSTAEGLVEWQRWCAQGADALKNYPALRELLRARVDAVVQSDIAVLDYCGHIVAGAKLSHANIMSSTEVLCRVLELSPDDATVAFESCAQAAARTLAIYALIDAGCRTTLVESRSDVFVATAVEQPTVFIGSLGPFVTLCEASELAGRTGDNASTAVSRLLGKHCRVAALYGAGFPRKVTTALRRAELNLLSIYGQRTHLCICVATPNDFEGESAGEPIAGNSIQIGAYNELFVAHNSQTFQGFFNRPVESAAAFTPDGTFLRTGDLVSRHGVGAVRIVGQVVDLITLASGVQVDIAQIEFALTQTPLVQHAVCFGEAREYLVAVLSLRRPAVEKWANAQGFVAPWTAMVQHHLVREELARAVALVNAAHPASSHVRKFAVTDGEFTVQSGELSGANTLVRGVVNAQFRHIVEELYDQ